MSGLSLEELKRRYEDPENIRQATLNHSTFRVEIWDEAIHHFPKYLLGRLDQIMCSPNIISAMHFYRDESCKLIVYHGRAHQTFIALLMTLANAHGDNTIRCWSLFEDLTIKCQELDPFIGTNLYEALARESDDS